MNADAVQIRPATPADAAALADLAAATFADTFGAENTAEDLAAFLAATYSPARQRDEIEDPAMTTLVADDGGTLVGFAQLRHGDDAPAGLDPAATVELQRLYVTRAWHGRGLAQRLMAAVEDAARARRAHAMWLGVWERNARAIAYYRKTGFALAGEKTFVVGTDVQRDLVLVRSL